MSLIIKDAFKVKQVDQKFYYYFYHTCLPNRDHDHGSWCECENP